MKLRLLVPMLVMILLAAISNAATNQQAAEVMLEAERNIIDMQQGEVNTTSANLTLAVAKIILEVSLLNTTIDSNSTCSNYSNIAEERYLS